MAVAYDTLEFSERLQAVGMEKAHADAHAKAVRDLVMAELVTKTDLKAALDAQSLRFALMIGAASVTVVGAIVGILSAIKFL